MNKYKNGWGISTEIIMIFAFLVCLLIAIFYINKMGLLNNPENRGITSKEKEVVTNNTTYTDIESDLKSAAKSYVNHEYDEIGIDTLIITSSTLIENSYLGKMEDPDDSNGYCTGYVEVEETNDRIKYTPYINCKKYYTKGYVKRKDL